MYHANTVRKALLRRTIAACLLVTAIITVSPESWAEKNLFVASETDADRIHQLESSINNLMSKYQDMQMQLDETVMMRGAENGNTPSGRLLGAMSADSADGIEFVGTSSIIGSLNGKCLVKKQIAETEYQIVTEDDTQELCD